VELIEIEGVTALDGTSEHLAGSGLEVPAEGAARCEWSLPISGWVVGRHEPVVAVDVVQQDVRVASAGVDVARADVAAAYQGMPGVERAGFSLRMGAVWLPESFALRLEAAFANGHRVPFAVIHGRRAPLAVSANGPIEAISVTALPRSGGTLVMQLLAAHPDVVVAGAYPYSARPAAYWEHMLRVLSAPADPRSSSDPDTFDTNLSWIGSHPFNAPPLTDSPEAAAWLGREYVEELAAFAQRASGELYARVAASQGLSEPRFYAEKREPGPTARLTTLLHPGGREILVVRDFRDMACSMLAATRPADVTLRGDADFILSLVPALARLIAYTHERADSALVVRYEDLISRPAQSFERIFEHLGLKCTRKRLRAIVEEVGTETPELIAHRTSANPAMSVARHTTDLDADALAAAQECFRPALDAFGYALAG
jgi:hypothetical protein